MDKNCECASLCEFRSEDGEDRVEGTGVMREKKERQREKLRWNDKVRKTKSAAAGQRCMVRAKTSPSLHLCPLLSLLLVPRQPASLLVLLLPLLPLLLLLGVTPVRRPRPWPHGLLLVRHTLAGPPVPAEPHCLMVQLRPLPAS